MVAANAAIVEKGRMPGTYDQPYRTTPYAAITRQEDVAITERKQAERHLAELAQYDRQTRLPNHLGAALRPLSALGQ